VSTQRVGKELSFAEKRIQILFISQSKQKNTKLNETQKRIIQIQTK